MKTFLVTLVLFLGNISSAQMATFGLPEQDALVKTLRAKFNSATSPASNEMVNKSFNCIEKISIKDNFTQSPFTMGFDELSGLVRLSSCSGCNARGALLIDNGREQIASVQLAGNRGAYLAARMTTKKELIIEWSATPIADDVATLLPLADAPNAKVNSYSLCTVIPTP